MILTDYFYSTPSLGWAYAKQCGVTHGVIRLPETAEFDYTEEAHWIDIYNRFLSYGITPILIEPMPNALHDHIKSGDSHRDASIDAVIRMFPIMDKLNIRTICFNFMAYVGWVRTNKDLIERGGALVTGFDSENYTPSNNAISAAQLWENYEYFIKAILPYAERYHIKLALHPDDPPVEKLGNVSRIMTSYTNIRKALSLVPSDMLGVTMCQASYYMMGENLPKVISELGEKIFFVHFRNASGTKSKFRETFHDNGSIDMVEMIRLYLKYCPDVPIRVDHVPTMAGEDNGIPGYGEIGRLFAIGYLKGILEASCNKN